MPVCHDGALNPVPVRAAAVQVPSQLGPVAPRRGRQAAEAGGRRS
jgi:hypothetical protein